jgi:hypothetical protein
MRAPASRQIVAEIPKPSTVSSSQRGDGADIRSAHDLAGRQHWIAWHYRNLVC